MVQKAFINEIVLHLDEAAHCQVEEFLDLITLGLFTLFCTVYVLLLYLFICFFRVAEHLDALAIQTRVHITEIEENFVDVLVHVAEQVEFLEPSRRLPLFVDEFLEDSLGLGFQLVDFGFEEEELVLQFGKVFLDLEDFVGGVHWSQGGFVLEVFEHLVQ